MTESIHRDLVTVHEAVIGGRIADLRLEFYYAAKRLLDITIALVSLVILVPVMVAVAIAIRLDSPGPALFVQERIGGRRTKFEGRPEWSIRPFRLVKFRTMVHDADPSLHREYIAAYIEGDTESLKRHRAGAESEDSYKLQLDPRITRVGRILRKLSLDELPQLFNVIRGDMSLVGPRPALSYEVEMFRRQDLQRFAAQAGITGLAQVDGRCTLTFEEMISKDIEYVAAPSIARDFGILFRTVPVVLSRKGAG
jgi:lipopolysaccharide/colanic/teichoic acid biosynthesis glycosyltransferase